MACRICAWLGCGKEELSRAWVILLFDGGVEVAECSSSLGGLVQDVAPAEAPGRIVKTKLMSCAVGAEPLEWSILELGVHLRDPNAHQNSGRTATRAISYTLSCLHRQHYLDSLVADGNPPSESGEKWGIHSCIESRLMQPKRASTDS